MIDVRNTNNNEKLPNKDWDELYSDKKDVDACSIIAKIK